MRPPPSVLFVFFTLFFCLSEPCPAKPQSSESASSPRVRSDSAIVSLLQQSHDLNPLLPIRMRLDLLGGQAEMISSLRPDLGEAWANELLTLSPQTEEAERSFAEDKAMTILARLNPDRALGLLHSISGEELDAHRKLWTSPRQLVREVFQSLVARDGVKALPILGQEAERIGIQGHYPYSAVAQAAMQSVSKDWGRNNQHAVEVLQPVFERQFANYSQDNRRGYYDDLEFARMLQVVAGGLPKESIRPAVRLLVKNLLGTDTKTYQFEAEVYTQDGKKARVDNAVDAAILHVGPLINRVDPELAQELATNRPELKIALEYAQDGRMRSGMFGPCPCSPDPELDTSMDAMRLSNINADADSAKTEQLPKDRESARTILVVARNISRENPQRAAELIAKAQEEQKEPDEEFQLEVIAAKAHVAASQGQTDEFRELLARGLDLANRIIAKQQAGRPYVIEGLQPLVRIGIQREPDLTLAFVQNLPAVTPKAGLLYDAAWALKNLNRPGQ